MVDRVVPNRQGLKQNWKQFTLLLIVNAFVGGMVGMERSIFPQFASENFGIESVTSMVSFITAFGISKAIANYFMGKLANRLGRRTLLIAGWILALPVPFLLMSAPSWFWVVFANILLGISQGLTWSSTVVMKIDLVGDKNRGFAMGLNEFSGYLSVGLVALWSSWTAHEYGTTPYPFFIGVLLSVLGFTISVLWIKDTDTLINQEMKDIASADTQITVQTEINTSISTHPASVSAATASVFAPTASVFAPRSSSIFWDTTLFDKTLSSVTQAGLVNNLNDGMMWGLLPLLLLGYSFDNEHIGWIAAVYPAVWGLGQLFTGGLADRYNKKNLLFWGMLIQGIAIVLLPLTDSFSWLMVISASLGLGTALVYPTFLTSIASASAPKDRAERIGIFRLWRDLGYAVGALVSGIAADFLGLDVAIYLVALTTLASAGIIQKRMPTI